MSSGVSFNTGNFGNLTAMQANSAVGSVKQQVESTLSQLGETQRNAQSMASQFSEKSGSLTDKARSYQAMADSTDDPTLKAKYQKQADEFKAQAEEAKGKFNELNDFIKEIETKQTETCSQMRALEEYGNSSGSSQFKSAATLESEGKTYHSFAKNGNHWYADEPKEQNAPDFSGILKGLKDFFGSASFSAYDSMRKENPNGMF